MVTKVSNLLNKSSSYEFAKDLNHKVGEDSIFANIYLIAVVLFIALVFIGYTIYHYMNISNEFIIQNNTSFYGSDILVYEPLFKETAKTINDCINICSNNIICDGITYNLDTKTCTGTKNGVIRNETASYSSWVKPPDLKEISTTSDFTKSILVGYTTSMKIIDSKLMQNPYQRGSFAFSFNLTIYDFNKNYGSWRHIFHKGTIIDNGTIINYQSWENLVINFPKQSIGVWLAPFTNNLRIAVTTSSQGDKNSGSYAHAFIEDCNSLTNDCYTTDMPNGKWTDRKRMGDGSIPNTRLTNYVEFFDNDLQNIPINKQLNITINFKGKNAEVYFDGKIIKAIQLDALPIISNSSLYVMNDSTFGGEITNLIYYPDALNLDDINNIISLVPKNTE